MLQEKKQYLNLSLQNKLQKQQQFKSQPQTQKEKNLEYGFNYDRHQAIPTGIK